MVAMDNGATDIGVSRGVCSAMMNQGQGTQSSTNGGFLTIYSDHYKGIAEQSIVGKYVPDPRMSCLKPYIMQIEAQALFIRAFHYMYLTDAFW